MTTPLIEAIARAMDERHLMVSPEGAARTALAAIAEAGMVIVPREPTEAMIAAGEDAPVGWRTVSDEGHSITISDASAYYSAMISAAQGDGE